MHAGKAIEASVVEASPDTESTTLTSEPTTAISPCDACKAALEGACYGLIIGGVIIAAPEEGAIAAVVLALTAAGLAFGADQVRDWITQAVRAGINTAKALAEFICKKARVC